MRSSYAVGLALIIGIWYGALAYTSCPHYACDFTWSWRAAGYFLRGMNPYANIYKQGPYPFDAPLYYAPPSFLSAVPLAWFPARWSGSIFVAASVALYSCVCLVRGEKYRLLMLLSPLAWIAAGNMQWSFLIATALLTPSLAWLWMLKPSLGLSVVLRWRLRYTLPGFLVLLVCFLVAPSYWSGWLAALRLNHHTMPALVLPGGLLLLALLRFTDRDMRSFVALSCVPQVLGWYDQVPLFSLLVSPSEYMIYLGCTWFSFVVGLLGFYNPSHTAIVVPGFLNFQVVTLYLPLLVLLFHRSGTLVLLKNRLQLLLAH